MERFRDTIMAETLGTKLTQMHKGEWDLFVKDRMQAVFSEAIEGAPLSLLLRVV